MHWRSMADEERAAVGQNPGPLSPPNQLWQLRKILLNFFFFAPPPSPSPPPPPDYIAPFPPFPLLPNSFVSRFSRFHGSSSHHLFVCFHISFHHSQLSCLFSHLLSPLSCLFSHLLSPLSRLLSHLLSPLSRLLSHLLSPLSCLFSPLLSPLSRLFSHLLSPLQLSVVTSPLTTQLFSHLHTQLTVFSPPSSRH